jgi:hypothetical protein
MSSFLRTRTLSVAGALDRRLHTSPRAPTDTVSAPERAKPARNSFHGCKLLSAARLSSYHCTRPHPCTVTAAHHPNTRPPDTHAISARLEYQGSLVNTYSTYDLRRIPARAPLRSRRALTLTRSSAGVGLPGLRRNNMSRSDDEQDNDARGSSPAARGGAVSFDARARRDARDRESSRVWRPADFPAIALFVNCG